MTRYLSHGPSRKQRGLQDCSREGTRYEFVKKFLQFFSCHTAKDCCDVSTWADPTDMKGMQRTWITNKPRPGCSHHQDTVTLTFPRGVMECVALCSTADRWDCLQSSDSLSLCYIEGWWSCPLDKFGHLNLNNETEQDADRSHITRSTWHISEDPPKYSCPSWDGKMLRDVLGSDLGPRQRLWLCLSQDTCIS
ncbi:hypothetical protein GWK47_033796 [Chionoecetes opilio]|uniref:Uncharacterized protein n=1 Tax=Chionoecetes opilio TaxID=41210 RepID=A0A8J5CPE3_CHIOP|nr:hypothetical protein GWK47_033796 [Chionoecetes opilio]